MTDQQLAQVSTIATIIGVIVGCIGAFYTCLSYFETRAQRTALSNGSTAELPNTNPTGAHEQRLPCRALGLAFLSFVAFAIAGVALWFLYSMASAQQIGPRGERGETGPRGPAGQLSQQDAAVIALVPSFETRIKKLEMDEERRRVIENDNYCIDFLKKSSIRDQLEHAGKTQLNYISENCDVGCTPPMDWGLVIDRINESLSRCANKPEDLKNYSPAKNVIDTQVEGEPKMTIENIDIVHRYRIFYSRFQFTLRQFDKYLEKLEMHRF